MSKTLNVCLDSNILVSAIGFGGKPLRVLELALKKEFLLISSEHILTEVHRNLVSKLGFNPRDFTHFLEMITEVAVLFSPTGLVSVASESADNLVIETALMGYADVLVTGDRELVDLGKVGDLKIERTSVFLLRFKSA